MSNKRYERIDTQLSTAAIDLLLNMIESSIYEYTPEIENFRNELRARLQRKDTDPHAPLNQELSCDSWLTQ